MCLIVILQYNHIICKRTKIMENKYKIFIVDSVRNKEKDVNRK